MNIKCNVVQKWYKMLVYDKEVGRFERVYREAESLESAKLMLTENQKFIQLLKEGELDNG